MWRGIDPDLLHAELRVLKDHGLTMTRSFLYWPDAMPEPDRLDGEVLRRFETFLDLHTELGMQTVPTFIVGHMSGENWDPSWRAGRDLYADTWMVARQAWFAREVTRRFAEHPAVAGWLISNEMPIYGGAGQSAIVSSWAELMVQAVRAGGGTQPVSIGDGAWGIEVTGKDNGFSVRGLAQITDFVGPHVYPMETDVVRQHLKAAFICELASVGQRPVVLEEFGLTTDFASDENAAHYYRQVLHLTLLAGATGWIGWNNTDFDNLVEQDPYRHHPFELHFGLTRVDGSAKPQLLEMRDFAAVLEAVDLAGCQRRAAQTALVVPVYLETAEPLTVEEAERTYVFRCLEQAYLACREADMPPGMARERDGIADGYRLYLVPSVKALTAPTWLRLRDLARSGATIYASYGAGEVEFQRGPWWTASEEIFGVLHRLIYGLNDPVEEDVVELRFEQDLGPIDAGDVLRFRAAGGVNARTRMPVETVGAEVIARDQAGRVALTRHRLGKGAAILSAYPIEYFAAARGNANPDDSPRLYAALADVAGVERPVTVDDPAVLVDALVHESGRELVWLVSESAEERLVTPQLQDAATLVPLGGGDPVAEVRLPAYGVQVFELRPADHTVRVMTDGKA
ncbi:beta-mannosidase [Leekyejoonella antrihumi]|uniref:Beta-mannosidase n=2 Tax=Leekyejoonella antrihumi TaxID=1660198 RepID=A0A563E2U1_9MICO|nr:beta-mannosidase [Leekyejoonella antrihumi]